MEQKAECISIGTKNESSLHAQLKRWYSITGDRLEVEVQGYFIDLVRDDILIEIQTRNFSAISRKIKKLLETNVVRLVHPVAVAKYIIKLNNTGDKVISSRKSPKCGNIYTIFDELIRMPELMMHENFSFEALLISEEEIRIDDGKGSYRRKGVSIIDRRLLDVMGRVFFRDKEDYAKLIPEELDKHFTNKDISKALGLKPSTSRKFTYCLKKMGIIKEVGKKGNLLVYEVVK